MPAIQSAVLAGITANKGLDLDGHTWEELTREAKQLENDLDSKLLTLGRLTSAALRAQRYDTFRAPSIGEDSPLKQAEMVAVDLQQGLEQLGAIVEALTVRTEEAGTSLHTLQRHRDLYLEYSKDFRKEHLRNARDHASLIYSVREEINTQRHARNTDPRSLLMTEQQRIESAQEATNHIIDMAHATQGGLMIQRSWLDGLGRKLHVVTDRFPVLNQIMTKVRLRRRRDQLICLLLLIFLLFITYLSIRR